MLKNASVQTVFNLFSLILQRGIDDAAYHSIGDENAYIRLEHRDPNPVVTAVSNIVICVKIVFANEATCNKDLN